MSLLNTHSLKIKKFQFFCQFCFNGLWDRGVFGCPAHDQRDFDFAKKYGLEIIKVVSDGNETELKEAYTGNGNLINSSFLNNLNIEQAKKVIIDKIEEIKIGSKHFFV